MFADNSIVCQTTDKRIVIDNIYVKYFAKATGFTFFPFKHHEVFTYFFKPDLDIYLF